MLAAFLLTLAPCSFFSLASYVSRDETEKNSACWMQLVLPGACLEETSHTPYSRLHCDPQNGKFTFIEIDARRNIFALRG
jgi:hypothetical protein